MLVAELLRGGDAVAQKETFDHAPSQIVVGEHVNMIRHVLRAGGGVLGMYVTGDEIQKLSSIFLERPSGKQKKEHSQ